MSLGVLLKSDALVEDSISTLRAERQTNELRDRDHTATCRLQ
jgi:hypothetical protein